MKLIKTMLALSLLLMLPSCTSGDSTSLIGEVQVTYPYYETFTSTLDNSEAVLLVTAGETFETTGQLMQSPPDGESSPRSRPPDVRLIVTPLTVLQVLNGKCETLYLEVKQFPLSSIYFPAQSRVCRAYI